MPNTDTRIGIGHTCVGAIRLCAIDVGFDMRLHGAGVKLSPGGDLVLAEGGVGYDAPDGSQHIVRGTREYVIDVLQKAGYTVQT